MRLEQASKNIKYTTIAYVMNNILKFVVRLVFVRALPIEYVGINGLLSDLLIMLSLVELGIGPAIIYSLYNPLVKNDIETIKSLMALFRKAYSYVGTCIIVGGILILPWLEWFIKDNDIANVQLFYMVFLLNTGISYFYSYKRSLLIADQKQYIDSIYQSSGQICLSILQIITLLLYPCYLVYIGLMLLVTVVENYAISKKADQIYPYLKDASIQTLDGNIKNTIIKNIKAIVIHKFGNITVFSITNLVLSKFIGLFAVGLYSNYHMILITVESFVGQFLMSISASIGNLIVLETDAKKQKIFKITEFIVAWQAMMVSCGFFVLLNVLIELWLGREFLLKENIVCWMIFYSYLKYMRRAVNVFKDASGLYWNDRYKPVAEAMISLAASVYLTIHYGIVGAIWGSIISTLLTGFWVEPYVLFNNSICIKLKAYYSDYFKYLVVTLIIAVLNKWLYGILFSEVTIINFVLGVFLCLVVSNVVWIVLFRKREEMAYLRDVARDKFGMKFL